MAKNPCKYPVLKVAALLTELRPLDGSAMAAIFMDDLLNYLMFSARFPLSMRLSSSSEITEAFDIDEFENRVDRGSLNEDGVLKVNAFKKADDDQLMFQ
ncbi:MAG: hypothetical protein QRY72_04110 [Candidatus Rhabdochlamydia sp.]